MVSALSKQITSDAFSNVKQLVVNQPVTVDIFPHLTSLQYLRLADIPSDCDDWQWIQQLQGLTELVVSIRGMKAPNDNDSNLGRLTVNGHKAELNDVSEETSLTMAKVVGGLPEQLRIKVSNC